MTPNYGRALSALAALYGLQYTHNPGGGEFSHPDGLRCQIHGQDDKRDFAKVLAWVRESGANVEQDALFLPDEQKERLLLAIAGGV